MDSEPNFCSESDCNYYFDSDFESNPYYDQHPDSDSHPDCDLDSDSILILILNFSWTQFWLQADVDPIQI